MSKNKIIYVIVLLGCSAIAWIGCAKREIKNIDSRGKNIICFGNSITAGAGVGEGQDYPSLLSKMTGLPVVNAGGSGDTAYDGLNRIRQDVLDKDPLLVIVEFGGNDFLRRLPLKETVDNVRKITEMIQTRGAMVAITDVSSGLIMENYRKQYEKLSRQTGAIFIPNALGGILTNPSLKSDYIHPNAKGYKIIVQRIYRAIIPYLNQNNLSRRFK